MPETEAHKRWRLANPEKVKATYDKWYAENRETWLAHRRAKAPKKPRVIKDPAVKKREAAGKARFHKYGITPEEYEQKWQAQEGKCAVCGNPETRRNRSLCLDHNHTTEQPRDLLCGDCNSAIGLVKEDTRRLGAMINYLDRHNGNQQSC